MTRSNVTVFHRPNQPLRFMALATLIITICIFAVGPTAHAAWGNPQGVPQSFSALAQKVSPAVVNIRTVKTMNGGRSFRDFMPGPWKNDDPRRDFFERFFGPEQRREYKQRSLGSGFIISPDGYIVTNNHVVEKADEILVFLKDKKEYKATIEGLDPKTDLALIKIKTDEPLPTLPLGDSDALNIGEWVVAIGSPFGLEQTVTAGIISAKGRVIGSGPYDDFLQTDASINPGNSGGPLLNMEGEVIGINTAIIASGQGIGFAIPVNLARGIIDQLKQHGEVIRGWLGVHIQDLTDELMEYAGAKDKKGALVLEVFEGDPADKAGIKPKDIIREVNGHEIESVADLSLTIANIPVGETAKIQVLRNGKAKTFNVTISKRDDGDKIAKSYRHGEKGNDLGIKVEEITPEMARRYDLQQKSGIIVSGLSRDGKAAEAGLQAGDIITEINHQTITTLEDYENIMNEIDKNDDISFFIRRDRVGFLVIKITR